MEAEREVASLLPGLDMHEASELNYSNLKNTISDRLRMAKPQKVDKGRGFDL